MGDALYSRGATVEAVLDEALETLMRSLEREARRGGWKFALAGIGDHAIGFK